MEIGNHVFIGMNAIILKGVHIGNCVIIGAGSLVTKDIPDKSVVAGNPARVIMTIEEYYQKRQKAQLLEARELVCKYRAVYGREPGEKELHEFFWLFSDDPAALPELYKDMMCLVGNEAMSNQVMRGHKKLFEDRKDFLSSVK